jgi:hypothetical protein
MWQNIANTSISFGEEIAETKATSIQLKMVFMYIES